MDTRDAYKQKYEAQLAEWGAKFAGIKARSAKATAQAKIDVAPEVSAMQDKYEAAKAKLAHMALATDDKWDDVTRDADAAWHDFRSAVQGAFAALKPEKKRS